MPNQQLVLIRQYTASSKMATPRLIPSDLEKIACTSDSGTLHGAGIDYWTDWVGRNDFKHFTEAELRAKADESRRVLDTVKAVLD